MVKSLTYSYQKISTHADLEGYQYHISDCQAKETSMSGRLKNLDWLDLASQPKKLFRFSSRLVIQDAPTNYDRTPRIVPHPDADPCFDTETTGNTIQNAKTSSKVRRSDSHNPVFAFLRKYYLNKLPNCKPAASLRDKTPN